MVLTPSPDADFAESAKSFTRQRSYVHGITTFYVGKKEGYEKHKQIIAMFTHKKNQNGVSLT